MVVVVEYISTGGSGSGSSGDGGGCKGDGSDNDSSSNRSNIKQFQQQQLIVNIGHSIMPFQHLPINIIFIRLSHTLTCSYLTNFELLNEIMYTNEKVRCQEIK